ncbi:MAG: DUF4920 domain-containing protein [Croceitalea sp.]|nr:DUF4920 domain-containing protein [Croceitalea sp.]
MKLFNTFIAVFLLALSQPLLAQITTDGNAFGVAFELNKEHAGNWAVYETLKANDTTSTQLSGQITEVCQSKGCWMKVTIANDKEVLVRFKDYGFFVPLDASQKETIINGKAFISELSVDEQRHYAEDKGATKEEIAQIITPKKTLRFEADGVIINQ